MSWIIVLIKKREGIVSLMRQKLGDLEGFLGDKFDEIRGFNQKPFLMDLKIIFKNSKIIKIP